MILPDDQPAELPPTRAVERSVEAESLGGRPRWSLRTLLLVIAIYAGCLAATGPHGPVPITAGLIAATALSGVILCARIDHVVPIIGILIGSSVGIVVGLFVLQPLILGSFYGYPLDSGDEIKAGIIGASIGVVTGSWLMSFALHRFAGPPRRR